MHRTGIRPKIAGVETDVPLGTFSANQFLRYNATTGVIDTAAVGGGGITGPGVSAVDDIVTWNSTTGAIVKDSGIAITAMGDVKGPASSASGTLPSFNSLTGKSLQDSGVVAANVATANPANAIPGQLAAWIGSAPNILSSTGIAAGQYITNASAGVGASVVGEIPSWSNTGGNRIVGGSGLVAAGLAGLGVIPSCSQRVLMSDLTMIAAAAVVTTRAYFVYMGFTSKAIVLNRVEYWGTVAGTPTTLEVGLFSSPTAPAKAGQTLTKLVSGVVTTGTGLLTNTTAFAQAIAAGVHVWAGFRAAASTMPTVQGLTSDIGEGLVLFIDTATAFSAGASYAGALIAASVTAFQAPMLRATVD